MGQMFTYKDLKINIYYLIKDYLFDSWCSCKQVLKPTEHKIKFHKFFF